MVLESPHISEVEGDGENRGQMMLILFSQGNDLCSFMRNVYITLFPAPSWPLSFSARSLTLGDDISFIRFIIPDCLCFHSDLTVFAPPIFEQQTIGVDCRSFARGHEDGPAA